MINRTALITGASGGIGLELARIHASNGDNLVLIARSSDKLAEVRKELETVYKVEVFNIVKDLSVKDAAKEVFNEVRSKNIVVEYLINNAGFGDFGLFAGSDWNKQEQMIGLNITALAHLTRLFLPGMIDPEYRFPGIFSARTNNVSLFCLEGICPQFFRSNK
jgi:short-subunit dehydrogenase